MSGRRGIILCAMFFLGSYFMAQAELIFSSSFDTSVTAEKAGGNPNPIIEAGKYRLVPGISGQAVLVTSETPLAYQSEGNISTAEGSVSFWISPQNWDKGTQGVAPLYWLGTEGGYSMHYYAYYHLTPGGTPYLSFRRRLDPGKAEEKIIQDFNFASKQEVLAKDEWTHFVFTWTDWQFFMYINGEFAGRFDFSLPVEPSRLRRNDYIWIATSQFWGKDRNLVSKVDELRIYSEALKPSDVKALYTEYKSKVVTETKRSAIPVPLTSKEIIVDGKISPGEWDDATKIPVNKIFRQGKFISVPAWCMLKYDRNNLYVAFEVEYRVNLATPAEGRSINVFSGDEAEIILRPPGMQETEDPFFQFAVAPNGAYAYRLGKSADSEGWKWQSGFKHAVSIEDKSWFVEMAIPFADLKNIPKPWDTWLFQAGLHRASMESLGGMFERWISFSSGKDMFHRAEDMAFLIFQPDNTAIRVESIGDINAGHINFKLSALGKTTLDTRIKIRTPDKEIFSKSLLLSSGITEAVVVEDKIVGEGMLTIESFSPDRPVPVFSYSSRFFVKEPLVIEKKIHASLKETELNLDLSGLPSMFMEKLEQGNLSGRVMILSSESGEKYGEAEFVPKHKEETVKVKFKEMPPGEYIVKVKISDGAEQIENSVAFIRPDPSFLTAKVGVDRNVPAPWTPVELTDCSIKVWGREYSRDGLFPSSIKSQGVEVIKEMPRFYILKAGQKYFFKTVTETVKEKAEDRVVLSGRSRLETKDMNINMEWTRTVEFDGFIRFDINLSPVGGRQEIDGLFLEIFIEKEAAKHLISTKFQDVWETHGEYQSEPCSSIFLTGDRAGIEFVTETDANWVYEDGQKPVRVYKDGGKAIISCRIIGKTVSFDSPLSYTFALMPTPVKPLRNDWRSMHTDGWGMGKEGRQKFQSYHIYSSRQGIQWPNMALLTDMLNDESGLAEIKSWKNRGIDVIPYTLTAMMPDTNPYYDYYGTDWMATKEGKSLPKSYLIDRPWLSVPGKPFYLCAPVCVASGYGEFLAWSTDHIMGKYHFAGVYHDAGNSSYCDNQRHGCQRIDAFGRTAKTYNHFATREIYKRLYKIVHKHKTDGILWIHTGLNRMPYIQSFLDIQMLGEEYMHSAPLNPNVYTDEKDALLKWQTNYNAHLTGIPIHFIGHTCPKDEDMSLPPKNPKRDRAVVTMCILHDVRLSGNFIYPPTVEELWRIADETNLSAAVFKGYWLNEEIIPINRKILVSYYTWKDENKVLLILGNTTPETQETMLSFKGGFQGKDLKAVNLRTKTTVSLDNPLIVEDRDFQAVLVSW